MNELGSAFSVIYKDHIGHDAACALGSTCSLKACIQAAEIWNFRASIPG